MFSRVRLFPVVIIAAIALFGIKVDQIRRGIMDLGITAAFAQAPAQGSAPASAKPAATGSGAAAATPAAQPGAAHAQPADAHGDAKTAMSPSDANAEHEYTPAEVQVLERLSKRREELDGRERGMLLREKLLTATEKRIDEKIASLKKLEATIQGLLKKHDAEEEKQLKSLVKIYERMKPKDAARILSQLDMKVLLDVAERMQEMKMAPILAAMDPKKAKALTIELATRRSLPQTGS